MTGLERLIHRLCETAALFGGVVLLFLILMSVASIFGRSVLPILTGFRPFSIPGDQELIEIGTAIAVFAFLPYTHLKKGHVRVESATTWAPLWFNKTCDLGANVLVLGLSCLILWRLYAGFLDKLAAGDSTLVLQVPLSVPYACVVLCAALMVLAGLVRIKDV